MRADPSVPMIASLGRYELLSRIGVGGMAEVYAARVRGEAGFLKLVAVKRMHEHLAEDERFVTMFLDEARTAAFINSPHVVQTLDLGRAEDRSLYLVMELVVGAALHQLLIRVVDKGQQVPLRIAAEIIAQAAQGLADAHQARTPMGQQLNVVHRDISPHNLLVGVDGRVRITDFGVARALFRNTRTVTGELKGKIGYFAPEQMRTDIDWRADIFSLGVVAWETLTGARLFHTDNPIERMEKIQSMRIPSVREVRPDIPEAVATVIAEALQRNREDRIQSAGELSRMLRAAAQPEVAGPDEIAVFLQEHCGDLIRAFETRLRVALEATSPGIDLSSIPALTEGTRSGIVASVASGAMTVSEEAKTRALRSDAAPDEAATRILIPTQLPRALVLAGAVAGLVALAALAFIVTYLLASG